MYLLKQNENVDYNYKEYYLDTEEELSQINKKYCCPGSVAYIIDSTNIYILNADKEWILQGTSGGGGRPARLQVKEITITENTTTNITPDSGFDGLSRISIITNIEGGSSEDLEDISALIDEINGEVV